MTIQYGFFLKSTFTKRPDHYAHLEDTTFHTLCEAISSAYACHTMKEHVLNIFSINMDTGQVATIHNALDIDHIFTGMDNENNTDTSEADQRVIDSYNFRNSATL